MNRTTILTSTQQALLGHITKNMKAITIGYSDKSYIIRAYFSCTPTEEELELLEIVSTEVCADVPEFSLFKEEAIVANPDIQVNKLEMLDAWVYMEFYPRENS